MLGVDHYFFEWKKIPAKQKLLKNCKQCDIQG